MLQTAPRYTQRWQLWYQTFSDNLMKFKCPVLYRCPKMLWKGGSKRPFRTPHFWLKFSWKALALPKQSLKHWKEIPFIIYNMALCPLWSLWWLTGARLKNDIQQRSWLNESFCSRWIPKHTCWKQSLIWKSRLRVKNGFQAPDLIYVNIRLFMKIWPKCK